MMMFRLFPLVAMMAMASNAATRAVAGDGLCTMCSIGVAAIGQQQDSAHDTQRPLRIMITADLDFARIAVRAGGGMVALDPTSQGSRSEGGAIALGAAGYIGHVVVEGEPGRALRIDLPRTVMLSSMGGGELRIRNVRTNLSAAPRLGIDGRLEFSFGGDLSISGDADGNFRGSIPLTIDYE